MRRPFASPFVLLGFALAGCGGGGGGSSSPSGVPFRIAWAARSRAVAGPSSALSAVVTLAGAAPDGGDLTTTVDRKNDPGAYTSRAAFPTHPKAGVYTLTVRFYADPNGGGMLVAEGSQTVDLKADGSGIGSIGTTNVVATVEVLPKQVVVTGGRVPLEFAAKDDQGNLVAVSPGSAIWSTVGGESSLDLGKDGQAKATGTGVTTVKVSLDGRTSAPMPVFASKRPLASVAVDPNQTMPLDDLRPLTVTVKDDAGGTIEVPRGFIRWSVQEGLSLVGISEDGVPYPVYEHIGVSGGYAIAKIGSVASDPTSFGFSAPTPPTVTIDPGQTIWPGDVKRLTFTAKDKRGNVVPLPNDTTLTVESGADVVNDLGGFAVQAVRPGTAVLRVHYLGLVSAPQTVTVLAPDSITLEAATPPPITLFQRGQLTFVARDAQGTEVQVPLGDVTWENLTDDWHLNLGQGGDYSGIQQPGVFSVRVRVHGVYSQPVTVTILPAP